MANPKIKCPKCETENPIDILKADDGSRILCRGCNKFITLRFNGESPKKIIDDLKGIFKM
jgi:transposase-like protein